MLAAVLLRSSVVGHAMLSRHLLLAGRGILLEKEKNKQTNKQTRKENKIMMMMMMTIVKKQLLIFAFLFAVKCLGQFIGVVRNRNTIFMLHRVQT